jgi:hypothetical protein
MNNRYDPINKKYYRPLEIVESINSWVFYLSAVLSFAPIFIDKIEYPTLIDNVIILFAISVIIYAILGSISHLYLLPRAQEARHKEFLSTAMGIELIHERTVGYYNTDKEEKFQRLGMMLFENTFFTMQILQKMAFGIRLKTFIYIFIWFFALFLRKTSLDWLSLATIVIFSEEILSRWLRLEWQRNKIENIYNEIRKTLQSRPTKQKHIVFIMDSLISYENAKSVGGILLSSKIFEKMNPSLTIEWERIKKGI